MNSSTFFQFTKARSSQVANRAAAFPPSDMKPGSAVVSFQLQPKSKQLDVAHGNAFRLKSVPAWITD